MDPFIVFETATLSQQEAEQNISSLKKCMANMPEPPAWGMFSEISLVNNKLTASMTFSAEWKALIVLKGKDKDLVDSMDLMRNPFNRFVGRWTGRLRNHGFQIVIVGYVLAD